MGLSDTCPSTQGHVRHGPSPLVPQGPSPITQGPSAGHRSSVTLPVTHPVYAHSTAACPETFVPYSSTVTFDAHELLSAFPSMRVQTVHGHEGPTGKRARTNPISGRGPKSVFVVDVDDKPNSAFLINWIACNAHHLNLDGSVKMFAADKRFERQARRHRH